jgi:energy-coupling factor transporter ATP-binding protein EcfA2
LTTPVFGCRLFPGLPIYGFIYGEIEMFIESIEIENYKSYSQSEKIKFVQGFNVVVGANNAGKTALIEALSIKFVNKPHRSLKTIPTPGAKPPGDSKVHIRFEIPQEEFQDLLWENPQTLNIRKGKNDVHKNVEKRVLDAFSLPSLHLECSFGTGGGIINARIEEMDSEERTDQAIQFAIHDYKGPPTFLHNVISGVSPGQLTAGLLGHLVSNTIYFFKAERFNIGQFKVGSDPVLKPDASNLPQVLNLLMTSNPPRFRRLEGLIKMVFPDIKQITIPPTFEHQQMVRILLSHVDPLLEREDLALPLQESGTGIGQVLAILYVVINSPYPRPIIIDEPQSFLHPSAVRKLFGILRDQFPQHQYITATHSPIVVAASQPQRVVLLEKKEATTHVRTIDAQQADELRILLATVGAHLSDVFGAENILWVEGSTEENCFPLIISKKRPLLGTIILGVLNVGDLKGKHKIKILQIYRKLTQGGVLLPPAIGFIFDGEGLSQKEQEDIHRQGGGIVYFLPRRMYENYLLNPEAIAYVLSQLDENIRITSDEISKWIEENNKRPEYFRDKKIPDGNWLENIHGAKLLNDLFTSLTKERYEYDKVEHGIMLTKWLIENRLNELKEVEELIHKVLEPNGASK